MEGASEDGHRYCTQCSHSEQAAQSSISNGADSDSLGFLINVKVNRKFQKVASTSGIQ